MRECSCQLQALLMAESKSQYIVPTDARDHTYELITSSSYELINALEDGSNSYSRIASAQLGDNSNYLMPVSETDFGYLAISDNDYSPMQAAFSSTKFSCVERCDNLEFGQTGDSDSSGYNEQELSYATPVPTPLHDQQVAATAVVVYNSNAEAAATCDGNTQSSASNATVSASVVYDRQGVESAYSEIDDRVQGEGHTAAYSELDETMVYNEIQDDITTSSTPQWSATYSNEYAVNDVIIRTTTSQHRSLKQRVCATATIVLQIVALVITTIIKTRVGRQSDSQITAGSGENYGARLRSAVHVGDFQVLPCTVEGYADSTDVGILSYHNNSLLVGCMGGQLHIYATDGSYVTTFAVRETLRDATWTPRGNIVLAIQSVTLLTITAQGRTVSKLLDTVLSLYHRLCVSSDGVIYYATSAQIYNSTDDGTTWTLMFTFDDHFEDNIELIIRDRQADNVFWTLERNYGKTSKDFPQYLRRRDFTSLADASNLTRSSFELHKKMSAERNTYYSDLDFDGHNTLFITHGGVVYTHSTSTSDTSDTKALNEHTSTSSQLTPFSRESPAIVSAVDSDSGVLYVGTTKNTVSVYKLIYN